MLCWCHLCWDLYMAHFRTGCLQFFWPTCSFVCCQAESLFERRREAWEMAAGFRCDGQLYSWLGVSRPFALGCKLCRAAQQRSRWAEFLVETPIKEGVKNHSHSQKHRDSIARLMSEPQVLAECRRLVDLPSSPKSSPGQTRALGPWVPCLEAFEAAGRSIRKPKDGSFVPQVPESDTQRVRSRKRKAEIALDRKGGEQPQQWLLNHRMRRCMAEAQRQVWREALLPVRMTSGSQMSWSCSRWAIPTVWKATGAFWAWSVAWKARRAPSSMPWIKPLRASPPFIGMLQKWAL